VSELKSVNRSEKIDHFSREACSVAFIGAFFAKVEDRRSVWLLFRKN